MRTQDKGEIAKLKVELRSAEKGFIVSRPTEGSRYDLIIDDGKKLHRVQVKYANGKSSHASGCVELCLRKFVGDDGNISPKYKRRRTRTYTASEIDAVVAYLPAIDSVCWFNADVFDGKSSLTIRYEPTKNGQTTNLRMAQDYVW